MPFFSKSLPTPDPAKPTPLADEALLADIRARIVAYNASVDQRPNAIIRLRLSDLQDGPLVEITNRIAELLGAPAIPPWAP